MIEHSTGVGGRGAAALRTIGLVAASAVVSGLLLGRWVWPLDAVLRADLHGDSSLLTWNLWHMTEAVLAGRDPYVTSLLYAPVGANLATHTYGLGFLPIGLAARAVLGSAATYPIAAYRLAIWACFSLGLLASFHTLRRLGGAALPAAAGAVAWTFAPVFRSRAQETHLVALAFLLPLVTLAILRLVERPTAGRAGALGASLGACVYFSEYYSAFLWLGVLLLAGAAALLREPRERLWTTVTALGVRGGATGLAAFAVVVSPFLAHWALSDAQPLRPEQAYFESANLAGFVLPAPVATPLYRHAPAVERLAAEGQRGVGGELLFLGLPAVLFSVVALGADRRACVRLAWLIGGAFLVLSLGPELKVLGTNTRLPLPYRLLMEVPPFEMARAPARLAAIGLWGLVVAMTAGATAAAVAMQRKAGVAVALAFQAAVLAWCVAENVAPAPAVGPFAPPPVLATLGPGGVLNLPLSPRDSFAMLLQTFHGRPIATGYVSRLSRAQADHVARIDALLHGEAPALGAGLQRLGIGNAIVARGTPEADVERLRQAGLRVVDLRGLP